MTTGDSHAKQTLVACRDRDTAQTSLSRQWGRRPSKDSAFLLSGRSVDKCLANALFREVRWQLGHRSLRTERASASIRNQRSKGTTIAPSN
eukprot:1313248-Pleurochrysis_carterae.AAC.4